MAHVGDVERSIAFYALLGFECESRHRNPQGRTCWASLISRQARIFFAQAGPDLDPAQQAVLFYLYSDDLVALRAHLLASGLVDAGEYSGEGRKPAPVWGTMDARGLISTISRPFYMPAGEMRVHDPDGYCLLIGQLG